jgi:glycosyltransferase involved in cell wall biosynthesis
MRWRYDILHVHTAYPGGVAAATLRGIIKVPAIVTCHAADVQVHQELGYGLRLEPGIEAKIRCGLVSADAVTAVSKSVAGDVLALCPGIGNVPVVPNGVARRRFESNPSTSSGQVPANMRASLGIGPEHKLILAVGRNHPKKGYPDLVRALGILSQRRSDFRCVIVGGGTESLTPEIRALGLEETVILAGQYPRNGTNHLGPESAPPDELVSLYLESDVFVLPSYIEGLPLVIPEAMMAGLPVVATDVPGNKDVVVDGNNGMLVPAGDVHALVSSLDRILSDSEMHKRLSDGARHTASQLDWPQIARSYISIYESVIEAHPQGRIHRFHRLHR